jgi:hypothetical protein
LLLVPPFIAGFLVCQLLYRKSFKKLRNKTEELNILLRWMERQLDEQGRQIWQEMEPSHKAIDSLPETIQETFGLLEMMDTDVSPGRDSQETIELLDSESFAYAAHKRKVLITRMIGSDTLALKAQASISAIELTPALIGAPYRAVLQDGICLKTSAVVKISNRYIQTLNSVYKIEAVEFN